MLSPGSVKTQTSKCERVERTVREILWLQSGHFTKDGVKKNAKDGRGAILD